MKRKQTLSFKPQVSEETSLGVLFSWMTSLTLGSAWTWCALLTLESFQLHQPRQHQSWVQPQQLFWKNMELHSLKLTWKTWNGWLESDRFLSWPSQFSGACKLLVSGRVPIKFIYQPWRLGLWQALQHLQLWDQKITLESQKFRQMNSQMNSPKLGRVAQLENHFTCQQRQGSTLSYPDWFRFLGILISWLMKFITEYHWVGVHPLETAYGIHNQGLDS